MSIVSVQMESKGTGIKCFFNTVHYHMVQIASCHGPPPFVKGPVAEARLRVHLSLRIGKRTFEEAETETDVSQKKMRLEEGKFY